MPAANPLRGEVAFTAGGQERILRFGVNEICSLEAELEMSFDDIVEKLNDSPTMTIVRTVFMRAVVGDEITPDEAGAMLDELTIPVAIQLLATSRTRAAPERRDTSAPTAASTRRGPTPVAARFRGRAAVARAHC